MGRKPCCAKEGLNKGAWSAMEDNILTDFIRTHGEGKWRDVPLRAGLKRCGKSCRLRWLNYLRPDIKRGNFSKDEVDIIIKLHNLLGNRWSLIAGRLPGRTDNEIKNYWNTRLSKQVKKTRQARNSDPKIRPQETKVIQCTTEVLSPKEMSYEWSQPSNMVLDLDFEDPVRFREGHGSEDRNEVGYLSSWLSEEGVVEELWRSTEDLTQNEVDMDAFASTFLNLEEEC